MGVVSDLIHLGCTLKSFLLQTYVLWMDYVPVKISLIECWMDIFTVHTCGHFGGVRRPLSLLDHMGKVLRMLFTNGTIWNCYNSWVGGLTSVMVYFFSPKLKYSLWKEESSCRLSVINRKDKNIEINVLSITIVTIVTCLPVGRKSNFSQFSSKINTYLFCQMPYLNLVLTTTYSKFFWNIKAVECSL